VLPAEKGPPHRPHVKEQELGAVDGEKLERLLPKAGQRTRASPGGEEPVCLPVPKPVVKHSNVLAAADERRARVLPHLTVVPRRYRLVSRLPEGGEPPSRGIPLLHKASLVRQNRTALEARMEKTMRKATPTAALNRTQSLDPELRCGLAFLPAAAAALVEADEVRVVVADA